MQDLFLVLCLEYLTNLGAKGTQRSIFLYMNVGLSKIRELHLHMYVMHRMFYFERYCRSKEPFICSSNLKIHLTIRATRALLFLCCLP